MKYLTVLLLLVTLSLNAAEPEKPKSIMSEISIGLEPYGTISWPGLDESPDLGAGVNLVFGITKNLSLVAFGEGDSTSDPRFFDQVDRAGAGLRYTAWLGKRVSLDGGIAGAWNLQESYFFIRAPFGATAYIVKKDNFDFGIRAQWAFDISGNGKHGSTAGIASIGPVLNARF